MADIHCKYSGVYTYQVTRWYYTLYIKYKKLSSIGLFRILNKEATINTYNFYII